ncbi:MAG: APC family permease [Firmicutes bacterium]|nr:APC family permease [Bacillota bacterium]
MIMAVALGSSVGWGCFVMPGDWLRQAGVLGVAIGFVLGLLLMVIIAVNYSHLINKFPVSGGAFVYAYAGFERNHAFFCGWFLTLAYISIVALNATAVALLVKFIFPDLIARTGLLWQIAGWDVYLGEVAIAGISLVIFAYLNIKGADISGRMQFWMCMGFLAGAIMLAVGCILHPATALSGAGPLFPPGIKPWSAVVTIVAIAPWAYLGFDNVPQAAEEFDFPLSRALGLIVTALSLSCLMYILLVFATAMATPRDIIAAQTSSAWVTGDSIALLFGKAGLIVLAFSLLMGVATGLNGFYVSTSRLLFAMGRARIIPGIFARVHPKYGTPYTGIVFTGLVCLLAPLFGRQVLSWIVDMSSFGVTFAYFYTSATVFKFTRWSGEGAKPVLKALALLGTLSAAAFFLLMVIPALPSSLPWQCGIALGIWIVLGLIFYALRSKDFTRIPKEKMDYYIFGRKMLD